MYTKEQRGTELCVRELYTRGRSNPSLASDRNKPLFRSGRIGHCEEMKIAYVPHMYDAEIDARTAYHLQGRMRVRSVDIGYRMTLCFLYGEEDAVQRFPRSADSA